MAEWYKYIKRKRRVDPKDDLLYIIAADVIEFTEGILRAYGNNEGVVYWAGSVTGNQHIIDMAIAPNAKTDYGEFVVDHIANAEVVIVLNEHKRSHLAQVHSHPGTWVDHSGLDDKMAAFKRDGLLSLVVPEYGKTGMRPLVKNGIHRFKQKTFIRLANKYIKGQFTITGGPSILIDLRKPKEYEE